MLLEVIATAGKLNKKKKYFLILNILLEPILLIPYVAKVLLTLLIVLRLLIQHMYVQVLMLLHHTVSMYAHSKEVFVGQ